jgi:hypothetical protein
MGIYMSRGAGSIQRKLLSAFSKASETTAFTTRQLCSLVYGIKASDVEKKHRVSVLRAIKQISHSSATPKRAMPTLHRLVKKGERDDRWFRQTSSFKKRPINIARATSKRPRKHRRKPEAILSRLRELPIKRRLRFIADMDDFPLILIPGDVVEACLRAAHLLEVDIRERLLGRSDYPKTAPWKLLRQALNG